MSEHGTIAAYSRGKCRCSLCFEANRQYQKQWKMNNPDKVRASSRKHHETHKQIRNAVARERQWKRRGLNLTLDEWNRILDEYGHHCEIAGCQRIDLSPDHDHGTHEFRGILCGKHNRALGVFGDNIEGLQQAIAYLMMAEQRKGEH